MQTHFSGVRSRRYAFNRLSEDDRRVRIAASIAKSLALLAVVALLAGIIVMVPAGPDSQLALALALASGAMPSL
jgi:hypothetical protein